MENVLTKLEKYKEEIINSENEILTPIGVLIAENIIEKCEITVVEENALRLSIIKKKWEEMIEELELIKHSFSHDFYKDLDILIDEVKRYEKIFVSGLTDDISIEEDNESKSKIKFNQFINCDEYIPTCPLGYVDCIHDPAYTKHNYPDSYANKFGDMSPEAASKLVCNVRCTDYDDEDK